MKKQEKILKLFCDGSVNPQKKIGFASYLILEDISSFDSLKEQIKSKKFEDTSSTKLELEVLLWALEDESLKDKKVEVYTDCQNILTLENRREKLESNDYKTSTGKEVRNSLLYKEFYSLQDSLDCTFIKLEGHKKSSRKDEIDRVFSFVDKFSRKTLREYVKSKDS